MKRAESRDRANARRRRDPALHFVFVLCMVLLPGVGSLASGPRDHGSPSPERGNAAAVVRGAEELGARASMRGGGGLNHLSVVAPHLRHTSARPVRNVLSFSKAGDGAESAEPKLPVERRFARLPDERGAISVGTVTEGFLVGARELAAEGEHWRSLPHFRPRNIRYGTDEMVLMIERSAAAVAERFPGALLYVGNIGRHEGGDIPYSVSHNSGRDADLAFYMRDEDGESAYFPRFASFDDEGRSRYPQGHFVFDTERNWALVRALLQDPEARIQYLFISDGLRARLLEHAREIGDSPEIIARAGVVLRQPGAHIPHDDHLHVRVYCSAEDAMAGCVDSGRRHPWISNPREHREAGRARAVELLSSDDATVRSAAVERLRWLEARGEVQRIRPLIDDESEQVRAAVVRALASLSGVSDARLIAERFADESSLQVRSASIEAMRLRADDAAREAFLSWLEVLQGESNTPPGQQENRAASSKEPDLRFALVDAARELRSHRIVQALIPLLQSESLELRARVHDTLRLIANHDPAPGVELRQSETEVAAVDALIAGWQDWHAGSRYRRETPGQWVLRGFEEAGIALSDDRRERALQLVAAVTDERPWLSENAQRVLMAMTGDERRNALRWPKQDARAYWGYYVGQRRVPLSAYP